MTQLSFNKNYFGYAVILFFIEFLIGKYAHDEFIRPYVGDFLIVIFLYCLIKAFINIGVKTTAMAVLLISYVTETLQYLNILDFLGLRQSAWANLLLGNYFAWQDILAYSLGVLTIIVIEQISTVKHYNNQLFI